MRGLTLVEAAISIVLVGGLLITSMNLAGSAGAARLKEADRTRGRHLAAALLAEILTKKYAEPTDGGATIGLDAGESAATSRATLDDLDDYHGLIEATIRQADGTVLTGFDGFSRDVRVRWVDPSDLSVGRVAESGAKMVVVQVTKNTRLVATVTAVRSSSWVPTHAE